MLVSSRAHVLGNNGQLTAAERNKTVAGSIWEKLERSNVTTFRVSEEKMGSTGSEELQGLLVWTHTVMVWQESLYLCCCLCLWKTPSDKGWVSFAEIGFRIVSKSNNGHFN